MKTIVLIAVCGLVLVSGLPQKRDAGCSECTTAAQKAMTNTQCNNAGTSCECQDGYIEGTYSSSEECNLNCVDEDECDEDPCMDNQDCVNTHGSYICRCSDGYSWNGTMCLDVDDCDRSPCDINADCTNVAGPKWLCECKKGYKGRNGKMCTDIIECGVSADCGARSSCKDAMGSYECICDVGFAMSRSTGKCEDILECEMGLDNCDSKATCRDDCNGGYVCECMDGYYGSGMLGDCREDSSSSSDRGSGSGRGRGRGRGSRSGSGSGSGSGHGSVGIAITNIVGVGGGNSGHSGRGGHH